MQDARPQGPSGSSEVWATWKCKMWSSVFKVLQRHRSTPASQAEILRRPQPCLVMMLPDQWWCLLSSTGGSLGAGNVLILSCSVFAQWSTLCNVYGNLGRPLAGGGNSELNFKKEGAWGQRNLAVLEWTFKNIYPVSSHRGSVGTNPPRIHEDAGSVPGLTQWMKGFCVAEHWGVGRRCGLDPAWLWLWCRLAATNLIRPLAGELQYAGDAALKKPKKTPNNKKQNPKKCILPHLCSALQSNALSCALFHFHKTHLCQVRVG